MSVKTDSEVIIRPARESDLPEINTIYNHYVLNSTCTWRREPVTEAERGKWFQEHDDRMPVLVAESGGHVVGWASLSTFRTAYTHAGTLEDSVYVRHDWLRRGIGERLVRELIDAARRKGLHSILAVISGEQEASIRLHHKLGFRRAGLLVDVGQKFDRRLDAVFLQLHLVKDAQVAASSAASGNPGIRIRACMAVKRDGRILLVPHLKTDSAEVQWNLPGGRIEFGEALADAAAREFREETGLMAEVTGLIDVSEVFLPEKPWHSITVAFGGRITGGAEGVEPNHRYGEKKPRWFTAEELRAVAYHPKSIIDKALA